MRLFDKLFQMRERAFAPPAGRSEPASTANPELRDDSNFVRVFDKFGRECLITKEQWRTHVLPGTLKANWADPQKLYTVIVSALQEGFFADILEAAEYLHHTDPDPTRGTVAYGIALMKNGRLDDAERIFRSHIEKHAETGTLLTNLAKVYSARNETEKCDATLWRSLEVDPNQENGVTWYAAVWRERSGKNGAVEAWRRIATLPGSWRAQLWLARTALEAHDPERAFALYRESLSRVGDSVPADYLMQLSGDLGNHGFMAELLQLCEPLFVPEAHGLAVGNNLIKANLSLGRIARADMILRQLYTLNRPDWNKHLSYSDAEIAKARAGTR